MSAPQIFGVDFQGLFASAFGGKLTAMTLTKVTPGAYNAGDPLAGNQPTSVAYTCEGVTDKWTEKFVGEDNVRTVEFEAIVLLGTMSTLGIKPMPGDTIAVIRPVDGAAINARVLKGVVDPGGASATCKCMAL